MEVHHECKFNILSAFVFQYTVKNKTKVRKSLHYGKQICAMNLKESRYQTFQTKHVNIKLLPPFWVPWPLIIWPIVHLLVIITIVS